MPTPNAPARQNSSEDNNSTQPKTYAKQNQIGIFHNGMMQFYNAVEFENNCNNQPPPPPNGLQPQPLPQFPPLSPLHCENCGHQQTPNMIGYKPRYQYPSTPSSFTHDAQSNQSLNSHNPNGNYNQGSIAYHSNGHPPPANYYNQPSTSQYPAQQYASVPQSYSQQNQTGYQNPADNFDPVQQSEHPAQNFSNVPPLPRQQQQNPHFPQRNEGYNVKFNDLQASQGNNAQQYSNTPQPPPPPQQQQQQQQQQQEHSSNFLKHDKRYDSNNNEHQTGYPNQISYFNTGQRSQHPAQRNANAPAPPLPPPQQQLNAQFAQHSGGHNANHSEYQTALQNQPNHINSGYQRQYHSQPYANGPKPLPPHPQQQQQQQQNPQLSQHGGVQNPNYSGYQVEQQNQPTHTNSGCQGQYPAQQYVNGPPSLPHPQQQQQQNSILPQNDGRCNANQSGHQSGYQNQGNLYNHPTTSRYPGQHYGNVPPPCPPQQQQNPHFSQKNGGYNGSHSGPQSQPNYYNHSGANQNPQQYANFAPPPPQKKQQQQSGEGYNTNPYGHQTRPNPTNPSNQYQHSVQQYPTVPLYHSQQEQQQQPNPQFYQHGHGYNANHSGYQSGYQNQGNYDNQLNTSQYPVQQYANVPPPPPQQQQWAQQPVHNGYTGNPQQHQFYHNQFQQQGPSQSNQPSGRQYQGHSDQANMDQGDQQQKYNARYERQGFVYQQPPPEAYQQEANLGVDPNTHYRNEYANSHAAHEVPPAPQKYDGHLNRTRRNQYCPSLPILPILTYQDLAQQQYEESLQKDDNKTISSQQSLDNVNHAIPKATQQRTKQENEKGHTDKQTQNTVDKPTESSISRSPSIIQKDHDDPFPLEEPKICGVCNSKIEKKENKSATFSQNDRPKSAITSEDASTQTHLDRSECKNHSSCSSIQIKVETDPNDDTSSEATPVELSPVEKERLETADKSPEAENTMSALNSKHTTHREESSQKEQRTYSKTQNKTFTPSKLKTQVFTPRQLKIVRTQEEPSKRKGLFRRRTGSPTVIPRHQVPSSSTDDHNNAPSYNRHDESGYKEAFPSLPSDPNYRGTSNQCIITKKCGYNVQLSKTRKQNAVRTSKKVVAASPTSSKPPLSNTSRKVVDENKVYNGPRRHNVHNRNTDGWIVPKKTVPVDRIRRKRPLIEEEDEYDQKNTEHSNPSVTNSAIPAAETILLLEKNDEQIEEKAVEKDAVATPVATTLSKSERKRLIKENKAQRLQEFVAILSSQTAVATASSTEGPDFEDEQLLQRIALSTESSTNKDVDSEAEMAQRQQESSIKVHETLDQNNGSINIPFRSFQITSQKTRAERVAESDRRRKEHKRRQEKERNQIMGFMNLFDYESTLYDLVSMRLSSVCMKDVKAEKKKIKRMSPEQFTEQYNSKTSPCEQNLKDAVLINLYTEAMTVSRCPLLAFHVPRTPVGVLDQHPTRLGTNFLLLLTNFPYMDWTVPGCAVECQQYLWSRQQFFSRKSGSAAKKMSSFLKLLETHRTNIVVQDVTGLKEVARFRTTNKEIEYMYHEMMMFTVQKYLACRFTPRVATVELIRTYMVTDVEDQYLSYFCKYINRQTNIRYLKNKAEFLTDGEKTFYNCSLQVEKYIGKCNIKRAQCNFRVMKANRVEGYPSLSRFFDFLSRIHSSIVTIDLFTLTLNPHYDVKNRHYHLVLLDLWFGYNERK